MASTPRRHPANQSSDAADRGRQIEWLLQQEPVGHTHLTPGNSGDLERSNSEACQLDPFGVLSGPLPFNDFNESTKYPSPLSQNDPGRIAVQQHDGANRSPSKSLHALAPDPGRDMYPNNSESARPRLDLDDVATSTSYGGNSVDWSPVSSSYHHFSVGDENNRDEIRERSSISSSETVSYWYLHRTKPG